MYKFNNGNGALICDKCRIIICEPYDGRNRINDALCDKCKKGKSIKKTKRVKSKTE